MNLNLDNYYSVEANKEYMSVSQFKNFKLCESKAMYDLENDFKEEKQAFLEGKLFEALVAGDANLFMAKHGKEIIAQTGKTAGQPKTNFKKVFLAAEKFNQQKFFKDIINKCQKQLILTGEIEGIKVKCALDLFDKDTYSIYDIKCMGNFDEQWNKAEKRYVPWYYNWGYVLQLAVYREIVKQNFGNPKEIGLIAATKEDIPDIEAISFSSELLDLELENFKLKIKRYDDIKKGKLEPTKCSCCDYCKSIKNINRFEVIK